MEHHRPKHFLKNKESVVKHCKAPLKKKKKKCTSLKKKPVVAKKAPCKKTVLKVKKCKKPAKKVKKPKKAKKPAKKCKKPKKAIKCKKVGVDKMNLGQVMAESGNFEQDEVEPVLWESEVSDEETSQHE